MGTGLRKEGGIDHETRGEGLKRGKDNPWDTTPGVNYWSYSLRGEKE